MDFDSGRLIRISVYSTGEELVVAICRCEGLVAGIGSLANLYVGSRMDI